MNKQAKKTMIMSILMSAPGPLILLINLFFGQSSTQIADFVRRAIELLAIILSFVVYLITTKDNMTDNIKKTKLEKASNIFVSIAMIVSGIIMIILAITSGNSDKGNVIPGFIIALLGFIANTIFFIRYTILGKKTNNSILATQGKLYRAKTFVDFSVTIALLTVLIWPNSKVSFYFDLIGTILVSVYLIVTGIISLIKMKNKAE